MVFPDIPCENTIYRKGMHQVHPSTKAPIATGVPDFGSVTAPQPSRNDPSWETDQLTHGERQIHTSSFQTGRCSGQGNGRVLTRDAA